MPPKKPPPKTGPASPKATGTAQKSAPVPPKGKQASPPSSGRAEAGNKSNLFAAFEGLVQIHPTEGKARLAISEEESAAYEDMLMAELTEHLEISEREARGLIDEAQTVASSQLLFEESTVRQRIQAAEMAKRSAVGRRASLVDNSLGSRIARKKSRMDAELAAEEEKLARQESSVPIDAAKNALLADREKWLANTAEVRSQLDDLQAEIEVFQVKNPEKKFESKKVVEKRKEFESKRNTLQQKLNKLDQLEAKYQARLLQERERQRRCSNLKGVDMDIITGQKNVLQKVVSMVIAQKQEAQNEILDENMFRQMVVQQGEEFYEELKLHEEEVKVLEQDLKALRAPPPQQVKQWGRAQRRDSKLRSEERAQSQDTPPRTTSSSGQVTTLPPIHKPSSARASEDPHTPHPVKQESMEEDDTEAGISDY